MNCGKLENVKQGWVKVKLQWSRKNELRKTGDTAGSTLSMTGFNGAARMNCGKPAIARINHGVTLASMEPQE